MMDYRGYLRRVSTAYTLYGLLPTTWQLAIISVVSAAGTFLGFYFGDPYRAFVGLMIAFGMGSMGMFFVQSIIRNATVYSKLGIGTIGIANAAADIKSNVVKEFYAITMQVGVQNTGVRDIFFKFIRCDLSILNLVNQDAKADQNIHLIPAGFPQTFNLATIQHIKVPIFRVGAPTPVVGKLKIEIAYGPRKDAWAYRFVYEADLSFAWSLNPPLKGGQQTAQVYVGNSITKNTHEVYHG
ncbi:MULTISPECIES: hypothetical protein [unclassified Bradyrhizobium]|uniref:hypothetical protein n=1 Tax=unclassified Bradyrhizobium TaxID=2631580 RepID=UPI002915F45B|nr:MULTISPECIES: hypothetical protein [unclassified Bradyrhizobium]